MRIFKTFYSILQRHDYYPTLCETAVFITLPSRASASSLARSWGGSAVLSGTGAAELRSGLIVSLLVAFGCRSCVLLLGGLARGRSLTF
jgi:hypothetical protein